MAKIIPFPPRASASPVQHDIQAALVKQWVAEDSPTETRREQMLARIRDLMAEAEPAPLDPSLAAHLAAIEAKLDTLLSKQKRRAS